MRKTVTAGILLAACVGAVVPNLASAQPWRDRGGYDYGRFQGYPEFNGIKEHLKRLINAGEADGSLTHEDAQGFVNQYKQILADERREFSYHGWNLPDDDRANIRDQLRQLDHDIDEARGEP